MNITTSGTHWFPLSFAPGRLVLIDVCGTFGGATVKPGYKAADGAFSPYLQADGATAVALATRGGFTARVARNSQVGVLVENASGTTDIVVDVIAAVDMPPGS